MLRQKVNWLITLQLNSILFSQKCCSAFTSKAKMSIEPAKMFCSQLRNTIYTRKNIYPFMSSCEVWTIHLHSLRNHVRGTSHFNSGNPFSIDCHNKMEVLYISNSVSSLCAYLPLQIAKVVEPDLKAWFSCYEGVDGWNFLFFSKSEHSSLLFTLSERCNISDREIDRKRTERGQ